MSVIKRFPGIGERPTERPLYRSAALHLAQRLRQDYWRQHKARGELVLYTDMIAKNQRRAEGVNEVRRIAGFLERNQARASRLLYLGERQKAMLKSLGLEGVPE